MRRRIVENHRASSSGRDAAIRIRETFYNKPAEKETEFDWSWPKNIRHIGEAYAVMYRSDKWKKRGDYENYKHICESKTPWKLYAAPGLEIARVELSGEARDVSTAQMPDTFAVLANCLGIQCRLYQKRGGRVVMPEGDDGLFEVQIPRAKLGSGKTRSGKVFLCIYVESEGPKLFIFGTELDVEKDGIVG